MAHHFRSRPITASDKYRQTRSAADVEEVEKSTDEALINPHMPQYITKSPWYLNNDKPSLSHQRASGDTFKTPLDKWYNKGIKRAKKVQKYRKGSCKNCGSMTHTDKFCVDRPRKYNAKHQNKTFGEDEQIQDLDLSFEARMDRWNGFDPSRYNNEVIPQWEQIDNERKRIRAAKLEQKLKDKEEKPKDEMEEMLSASDLDENEDLSDGDNSNDEERAKNPRVKSMNKNLRSRRETAKYLQNIRDDTAHYDGKSRAMRNNPNQDPEQENKKLYKGDNHNIYSGKYFDLMSQENFTREAEEKGNNTSLCTVSMPSQAEIAFKQYKQKKERMASDRNKELFDKYGGQEHTEIPDDVKLTALKEYYGKADGSNSQSKPEKSQEEIEALKNGHNMVWGSYVHEVHGPGYKCCYSFEKESKCRGVHGVKDFYAKEYERIYNKKPDLEAESKRKEAKQQEKKEQLQSKLQEFQGTLGEVIKSQMEQDNKEDEDSSSSDSDSDSSSSGSSSSSSSSSSSGSSSSSSPQVRKRDAKNKYRGQQDLFDLKADNLDQTKLSKALEKERGRKRQKVEGNEYNSLQADDVQVTAEGMEAYRMQRQLFEDPMRNFKNDDDV